MNVIKTPISIHHLYQCFKFVYTRKMPHVINYEDNLFILDSMVKVLSDAVKLEPDTEIFCQPIMLIIDEVDSALKKLKVLILDNKHHLDRADNIRLLTRISQAFIDALQEIMHCKPSLQPCNTALGSKLEHYFALHKAVVTELTEVLSETLGNDISAIDHVSGDELSGLMTTDKL